MNKTFILHVILFVISSMCYNISIIYPGLESPLLQLRGAISNGQGLACGIS